MEGQSLFLASFCACSVSKIGYLSPRAQQLTLAESSIASGQTHLITGWAVFEAQNQDAKFNLYIQHSEQSHITLQMTVSPASSRPNQLPLRSVVVLRGSTQPGGEKPAKELHEDAFRVEKVVWEDDHRHPDAE